MIHYLSGTLAHLTNDCAVIECGGVGFRVGISVSTAAGLSPFIGKNAKLYTYMSVTENDISLFGFYSEEELDLFVMLKSVSGIGPKSAISILGTLSPDDLRKAVINGDAKMISQAPGIGLKTAQMLIIKLKDKLGSLSTDEMPSEHGAYSGKGEKISQVVDTLTLYGFPRAKVIETLKRQDMGLPLEELISETLRTLGKEGGL